MFIDALQKKGFSNQILRIYRKPQKISENSESLCFASWVERSYSYEACALKDNERNIKKQQE